MEILIPRYFASTDRKLRVISNIFKGHSTWDRPPISIGFQSAVILEMQPIDSLLTILDNLQLKTQIMMIRMQNVHRGVVEPGGMVVAITTISMEDSTHISTGVEIFYGFPR